jgi:hypothetical protein
MSEERKRVSEVKIKKYYKSYRERHPSKGKESAVRATLNWAIGIHKFIFSEEQLEEAIEDYKKIIQLIEKDKDDQ